MRVAAAGTGSRRMNYASSPLLTSKTPPWRSRFVVLLMAAGSALLIGRAAYVQIVHAPFYVDKGEERYAYRIPLAAHRGQLQGKIVKKLQLGRAPAQAADAQQGWGALVQGIKSLSQHGLHAISRVQV